LNHIRRQGQNFAEAKFFLESGNGLKEHINSKKFKLANDVRVETVESS
jgi:hypothetical protein